MYKFFVYFMCESFKEIHSGQKQNFVTKDKKKNDKKKLKFIVELLLYYNIYVYIYGIMRNDKQITRTFRYMYVFAINK